MSRRTELFAALCLAVSLGSLGVLRLGLLGPEAQLVLTDLSEPVVLGLCAAMALWVALQFGEDEPPRQQWVPIGLGLLVFAVGDLIYAGQELVSGVAPSSPGLPELCYALFYPLVALGIVRAALAYRRLVRLWPLAAAAGAIGGVLLAATWVPFVRVASAEALPDPATGMVSLFFPAADVVFVVVPAILVLLVALRMRGARLAVPWVAVAFGGVIFAVSDAWFLYLQWAGTYEGGHLADAGWMLGGVLIAIGASLAADVNLVTRKRAESPGSRLEPREAVGPPAPATPTV